MEVLASSSSSVTKSNQLSDVVSEVVEENPNGQISGTPGLKEFSFADLKTATSDFKPEALLDEGGYGRVYKGWVDEKTLAPTKTGTGMAVAIKILNPEIIQAFEQWQSYKPKLTNFGLAKFWPSVDKSHVTSSIIDTYDHSAPEYIMFGRLSMKTDVYTFGIMLLELLMGSRVLDKHLVNGQFHLIERLKPKLSQFGKLEMFMDVKMQGQYNLGAAFKAAQLALKCLETQPRHRPSMRKVLVLLERIEEIEEKPKNSEPSSVVVMEQIEAMEEKPRNSELSSVVVGEQIDEMEEKPNNSKLSSPVSTSHCHGQPRIHHCLLT